MKIKTKTAPHGEKTIEFRVRFFTNNIAKEKGKILPKHCFANGMVYIMKNESHNISSLKKPIPFNSLHELPSAIEKILIKKRIKVHSSSKMKRYFVNMK